jgi:hypothetical protein
MVWMMVVLLRGFPLGSIILGCVHHCRTYSWFFGGAVHVSSTSTTSFLGGLAQWGLDDSRALMNSGRTVASSGAVVALMVGLV